MFSKLKNKFSMVNIHTKLFIIFIFAYAFLLLFVFNILNAQTARSEIILYVLDNDFVEF